MNIKICTPVIGKNLEEFVSNLKKTQEISDLIELRVDYIEGVNSEMVVKIQKEVSKSAIFTCRQKGEGGHYSGDEKDRVALLQNAIGVFDYVDIELSTLEEHDFQRDSKAKLIISYHNFEETPSYWDMQNIINDMNSYHPDILKIATMLKEEHEVTKIYRLLTNKPHTEERIVIGMGDYGKMTRIVGPILGGYLTYAATEYGESAPGQILVEELKNIYKVLELSC